ncbi:hypothetical protein Hanom_Chr05g00433811 [Helianthus anomalus]
MCWITSLTYKMRKKDVNCVVHKKCPPPVRHNYTKIPDEEDMPHFESSVPLNFEAFAVGLGFKKEISFNQAQ